MGVNVFLEHVYGRDGRVFMQHVYGRDVYVNVFLRLCEHVYGRECVSGTRLWA